MEIKMEKIETIDQYIAQFSKDEQIRMNHLKDLILNVCPDAEQRMSWGMPTFFYQGNNLVHFAQNKNHLGFYPANTGVEMFKERLKNFVCTKGSIHIPHDMKFPDKLIKDIVSFRMKENEGYAKEKEQAKWNKTRVMKELKSLGTAQTKKTYLRHDAKEPLFGVTTKDLKTVMKKTGKNQSLAMELFATGNYDAMYFAGMIAEPKKMKPQDFDKWIKEAYCQGIADYTVAVTLAETDFAQNVADEWIKSDEEFICSAGWSCYSWLLGNRADEEFDKDKIQKLLKEVETTLHQRQNNVRYAMNGFVIAVGISYLPLHQEAIETAKKIGQVEVDMGNTQCKTPNALQYIEKAIQSKRLGFKRKKVRC